MKYVAAYLLAVAGGKAKPTAEDIEKILGSVQCQIDKERITLLLKELENKDIKTVMEEGRKKLSAVPSGGAGAGAAAEKKEEEVEEEKVEEPDEDTESEDENLGLGLFGGGSDDSDSDDDSD